MVAELASGAVIFSEQRSRVLLLHEAAEDRWGFPKGHVETGESLRAAAKREINEETGLDRIELGAEIGTVMYRFFDPAASRNVLKIVVYFLGISRQRAVTTESIFDRWGWESPGRARDRLRFATDRHMLAAALRRIPKTEPREPLPARPSPAKRRTRR
ncbi:MAG: NUDIX domain-containing protein [Thermoplasmata archaeon]